MAGHHPFSELRAKIEADPTRAACLAAAEQRLTEEQRAYDQAMVELRRAHAFTQEQLARALDVSPAHVAQLERQANLYLTTLESYLLAMGERLDVVASLGDTQVTLTLDALFPSSDPVAAPEPTPAG